MTLMQAESTTGLTSRTAAVLAYLGWWVTGLIFWSIERRDRLVRFHAIQSTLAFGALAMSIATFVVLALLMLSFAPAAVPLFLSVAFGLWVLGLLLWVLALWKAARGRWWRIPLASRVAEARTRET
jgi:uncharacterized membrane protein